MSININGTFHDLNATPMVQSHCRKIRLLLAVTRTCNIHAQQVYNDANIVDVWDD